MDESGRSVSFRDITGKDLEMLDLVMRESEQNVRSGHVLDILTSLCTNKGADFGKLPPRVVRALYTELTTHILKNYIPKENWLRQCYSIQNGSFQNLESMESVPMSKFVAMCQIHQEAIDQIKNPTITPSGSEVQQGGDP